jgi:lipoprotein Spr
MYRKIVLAALAVTCCQLGVKAEELSRRQMKAILVAANDWTGTPYRFAGKDRSGIDCSHFVHAVYRQIVPDYEYRRAEDYLDDPQFRQTENPQPGDLIVFTAVNGMSAHVGIVTEPEARKFIGAQSSTGVKEASYAGKTYWGKRPYRFLALKNKPQAIARTNKQERKTDIITNHRTRSPHLTNNKSPRQLKTKNSPPQSIAYRPDPQSHRTIVIRDYTGQAFMVIPIAREQ